MKTLSSIPTSKLERAGKLLSTGAKVGVNYMKYYGNRVVGDAQQARQTLHQDNAGDIYDSLKELKGSALKVAQLLSMEKNILPREYVEKFSLSQFSVPPLSGALVRKSFRQYFGKNPDELFDTFTPESVNAASIGQVHCATKDGKTLAVKIQYPGVRESISSDLKLVKPIAMRMFNIPKQGSEPYFQEVESKLYEETDYTLELRRSQEISQACAHIPHLRFPTYYPEFSSDRILTMDWMEGVHLSEFVKEGFTPEEGQKIGQALWDFYMFQMHRLRQVHADPHPGNFLISPTRELVVIDFGCVKEIPEDFYLPYFELANPVNLQDRNFFNQKLEALEIILPTDTPQERAFFSELFHQMLHLFTRPLVGETFDFSDDSFFAEIAELGQKYARMQEIREMNTNRGSRHFIYLNRTFFGLYNMMHDLRAKDIQIHAFENY